jgi:hypothetical protein
MVSLVGFLKFIYLDKLGIEEEVQMEDDYVADHELQTVSIDSSNEILDVILGIECVVV